MTAKIVKPVTPEIWEQRGGFVGMCEHVARCAAICYNSEIKTGDDAVKFVDMLVRKGHGRALEFGTVYTVSPELPKGRTWADWNEQDGMFYITYNLRELIERGASLDDIAQNAKFLFSPDELKGMFRLRTTFHYPALSRGIADEFRTHTGLSTMMRSTRYVSATEEDGITVIEPSWLCQANGTQRAEFFRAMDAASVAYANLTRLGMKRQQAREVLPLAVKTEMVQCGFAPAWDNFLRLRTAKDAHPDARAVAIEMNKIYIDYKTALFK